MGKSGKLFKAFVAGVKAFKSPSKEKGEKDRSSRKADKDNMRKGGKEKCLWSLGKSSSRNHDSLTAAATFLGSPEIKSVQVEELHFKDVLPTSVSVTPVCSDGSKALSNMQDKSVASSGPLYRAREFEEKELAALKIQTAIRRYLAARRVFQALKAIVRLQALVRGRIVRKQAAAALRCMQALVKVQALARGRHVRTSELGQLVQRHIQQSRQQRKKPVGEGWVSSTATLQQWQAKAQSKQDAVMKRQRALVYAFSEQLNRCSSKQSSSSSNLDYQPDKSHWGWVWLERWMAAQPAGISYSVAKEQCNRKDTGETRSDFSVNTEGFEGGSSPQFEVENNHFISLGGYDNVGEDGDGQANHDMLESPATSEKKNAFCAIVQDVEHSKEKDEYGVCEMPDVDDNVPANSSVVERPRSFPVPPPPPPPPPVSTKVMPKAPPSFPLSPPFGMAASTQPLVERKLVPMSSRPTQPPPPPPPPYAKNANSPFANQGSCQQGAHPVNICSPHSASAHALLGEQKSSTGGTSVKFPRSDCSASSDLPSLPSVSSVSSTSVIQPVIESFPAPSIPGSYHEPLLTPNETSSPTSSIMSKNGMNMQDLCEEATVSAPASNTSHSLHKTLLPSQPFSTPPFSPEVLASSTQQYATSRTSLIIPNAIEEDMLDVLEESRVATNENNLTIPGEPGVDNADGPDVGRGFSVDNKARKAEQSDNDLDVDEPDEAIVKTDESTQINSPEVYGRGDVSSAFPDEKATEVVVNKHEASPTSRQGLPMEAVSPSVPNYMSTTKSSKAKIRSLNSPTQKLDSPKQKSDSPKPRFDSSKQKVDSSKPRFDSTKQKIESPKQKLDSPKQRLDSKQKADSSLQKEEPGVKRRHSLSTLEGKGSPVANKLAMHVRASSKGQLASLRGESSLEDAACSNETLWKRGK